MQVAHFPNEDPEQLKSVAFTNGKIISAELQLYRNLVLGKIDRGELEYAW